MTFFLQQIIDSKLQEKSQSPRKYRARYISEEVKWKKRIILKIVLGKFYIIIFIDSKLLMNGTSIVLDAIFFIFTFAPLLRSG